MATNPKPSCLSVIETMHAQWEAANAVYSAAETVPFDKAASDAAKSRANLATSAAYKEASAIHMAILHQRPRSVRDALILTAHMEVVADEGLGSSLPECEIAAVEFAIETLIAFLASHPDAGEPLSGWGGDLVAICAERVDDRTTTPWKGEAPPSDKAVEAAQQH